MNPTEQKRFDEQYQRHRRALKLQGMSGRTIDSYARAVRRLAGHFDCCPDRVTVEQLEDYFSQLVDSHSWSTVKVDRNGLQFFWRHVLKQDWHWLDLVKAPKVQSLPDILTIDETARLIAAVRHLRYRVFILTAYSMGLRLSETLSLQVGDIDAGRSRVHIRRGKGCKDRFVPLPERTLHALRALWRRHRNPRWLFPDPGGSPAHIARADKPMHRGGAQQALKAAVSDCGIKKRLASTACATATPSICLNRA